MPTKKTSSRKKTAAKAPPAPPEPLPTPDRKYGALIHTIADVSRAEAKRLIEKHGYRCMSDSGEARVTLRGDARARASYRAARNTAKS